MKKILYRITFVLAAVTLLISCEADYVMFDSSKNFVAFPAKATSVPEQGGQVGIEVYVVALDGPAVNVTFDFDLTGIAAPAVEGVDFTLVNSSKTLDFPDGSGYATILIQPIDNDEFTGNKMVNIMITGNSQDYVLGANSSNSLTLVDDEHPLKNWIGTYSVEALSYGSPGAWDEAWSVDISAVEGELEKLQIVVDEGAPFLAAFDTEAMTITIDPGTDVGDLYDYGPTLWYVGDFVDLDMESPIIGTIEEDGTIKIDKVAVWLPDITYYWDAFNTTWTKTGKKSAPATKDVSSKAARFK